MFGSRHEWMEHMSVHAETKWSCLQCSAEPKSFPTANAFKIHLREGHQEKFTEDELALIALSSMRKQRKFLPQCLFCEKYPMFETKNSSPSDYGNELLNHIGIEHLQHLALLSVPWDRSTRFVPKYSDGVKAFESYLPASLHLAPVLERHLANPIKPHLSTSELANLSRFHNSAGHADGYPAHTQNIVQRPIIPILQYSDYNDNERALSLVQWGKENSFGSTPSNSDDHASANLEARSTTSVGSFGGKALTTSALQTLNKSMRVETHSAIEVADVHFRDDLGLTHLHLAALRGQTKQTEYLVKAGVHIDDHHIVFGTPLGLAAYAGHGKTVGLLVSLGADLNSPCGGFGSALHAACSGGSLQTVHTLVRCGADVNVLRTFSNTTAETYHSLGLSRRKNNNNLARVLPEERDNKFPAISCQPLTVAVLFEHRDVVEALLHYDADGNALASSNSSRDGDTQIHSTFTPLMLASCIENAEILWLLVKWPALDVELKDSCGRSALHVAARTGDVKALEMLLLHNHDPAFINSVTVGGETALCAAVKFGHYHCMSVLLDNHANLDAPDSSGRTVMMYAAQVSDYDCMGMLLDGGADLNVQDTSGRTALAYAAQFSQDTNLRLLLDFGADPKLKSSIGRTPLMSTALRGDKGSAEILIKTDPSTSHLDIQDRNGKTALIVAAESGSTDIAELLTSHGAKLNEKDTQGNTALMHATANGYTACVRALVAGKAAIDATNNEGETAMSIGILNGNTECICILIESGASFKLVSPFLNAVELQQRLGHIIDDIDRINADFVGPKTIETAKILLEAQRDRLIAQTQRGKHAERQTQRLSHTLRWLRAAKLVSRRGSL